MKFFIATLILTLSLMTNSYAKDILWINPLNPTGGFGLYSREIANELNKNGFNVTIKTTSYNCALAKHLWDVSDTPTIMMSAANSDVGISHKTAVSCFIDTTRQNFLYFLHESTTSFCSVKDKTWQDFTRKNSSHTIVIQPTKEHDIVLEELSRVYQNNLRVIRVVNFNEVLPMIKVGEIDFVFRVSIHLVPELSGKCYWNNSQAVSMFPELKGLEKVFPKLSDQTFLMQKNLNAKDLESIKNVIKNAMKTNPEIKKMLERRGHMVYDWNTQEEFEKIMDTFFKAY